MYKHRLIAGLLLALPGAVLAEWKGEGELGLSVSTGNTDTQNLTTRLTLSREIERWRHKASFEALQSETDGTTTAERYVIAAKSDYRLSESLYAFGALRHEQDEFSSFEQQSTIAGGIGNRFVETEQMSLDLSAGLGYRTSKIRATGATSDEAIVRLGGLFGYKFNANVAFSEEVLIETGADNTYLEAASGLTAKVSDNLAAKITYLVKHNSDVSAGQKKNDTLTTASLVYSF